MMLYSLKRTIRSIIPPQLLSAYHLFVALLGSALYGFPSRKLIVIGVTGTKGKSSTTEFLSSIFEAAGYETAVLNSIRIKISSAMKPNTMRMSMPGRFFIQRFLSRAVEARCRVAILEETSEGARQHRHRGIALDALVFTNLAPEHIESHGSLEAYIAAKLELGNQLVRSSKRPRIMVANADDAVGSRFLTLPVEFALPYALSSTSHKASDTGGTFEFGETQMNIALPGDFSIANALAAATTARALGIPDGIIAKGLASLTRIPGRAERIEEGQPFIVVVDYAHTPESLQALYDAYADHRRIAILGSTGGGRDTWKRPVMGKTAAQNCDEVFLTDEDPYDEDPRSIVEQMRAGMAGIKEPRIVMDRREAMRAAFALAQPGDAVLITGKGTDPTIQGPRGTALPWSDARVAREELAALKRV
jgi:UDP-N-acetylmuramoyl-L-alanyl-D-glutamate--2,6-diaminopimelate ligase